MNKMINVLAGEIVINFTTILTAVIIAVIIAAVLGLLLAVASKYLHVEQDERIDKVAEMLPGYNCGACGNPGCRGMAESLLAGDSKLTQCKPGTQEMREQIAEYISTHPNEEGEYTKVKW